MLDSVTHCREGFQCSANQTKHVCVKKNHTLPENIFDVLPLLIYCGIRKQ